MTQRCKVPEGVRTLPAWPRVPAAVICAQTRAGTEFLRYDMEALVTPLHEGTAVWGTFPHGSAGAWVLRMR